MVKLVVSEKLPGGFYKPLGRLVGWSVGRSAGGSVGFSEVFHNDLLCRALQDTSEQRCSDVSCKKLSYSF